MMSRGPRFQLNCPEAVRSPPAGAMGEEKFAGKTFDIGRYIFREDEFGDEAY